MPSSRIDIRAALNKKSDLDLQNKAQKVRSRANADQVFLYIAESLEDVQKSIQDIQRALRKAPEVGRVEIAGADILDLVVGGEDGPGQLTILSGPPNFTRIGWDGTDDSGVSINITSVSGATVNTSTDHGVEPEDIVHIENSDSLVHNGYWVVATTPTPTSYTVASPPAGTGTGGTSTLQFAGGWRRSFAIGGTGFGDAPFFANNRGQVIIGRNGSVLLQDLDGVDKGFLGVKSSPTRTITGAVNNGSGLIRITTSVAHGFPDGDGVTIAGVTGIPGANGLFGIVLVNATTFDLFGSTFSGSYGGGGTAFQDFAGIWVETAAIGGTGYGNAPFFAQEDGTVVIGKNGSVVIQDSISVDRGFLGVRTEASKSVTGTANNGDGLVRLTVVAHGYGTGDVIRAGATGWPIRVITVDTFDLLGSVFGTFVAVPTVARFFAGIWSEMGAFGGTGYANAPLKTNSSGSYLTNANIEINGEDEFGDLFQLLISPSAIRLENITQDTLINMGFDGGIDFVDQSATAYGAFVKPGLVEVRRGALIKGTLGIRQSIVGPDTDYGSFLSLAASFFNQASVQTTISLDAITGFIEGGTLEATGSVRSSGASAGLTGAGVEMNYSVGTDEGFVIAYDRTGLVYKPLGVDGLPLALNAVSGANVLVGTDTDAGTALLQIAGTVKATGNIDAASLSLSTPLDVADGGTSSSTIGAARTTLDVYSKAEVDALVGGGGVTDGDTFVKTISFFPVTIQYKDWAGVNQSVSGVVTNLTGTDEFMGFTNGRRTA